MGIWRRLVGASLLVLPLIAGISGAALAQTRTLIPVPANKAPNVDLEVSVDRHELRIGEVVTICFKASQRGFVTLWNISAEGSVARIFPNAFQPTSPDTMAVAANQQFCAGKEGDAFRFQVAGPPGIDDLYMLWTATPDLQPAPATFSDAADWARSLDRLRVALAERWGTAKTSFDIVPASGPVPPRLDLPPPGPSATPLPAPPAVVSPPPPPAPVVAAPPPPAPVPPAPVVAPPPPAPIATPVPPPASPTPLPSQLLPSPSAAAPAIAPPPPAPVPVPTPAISPPPPRPAPAPMPAVAPPPPRPAPAPSPPRLDQAEAPKIYVLSMGSNVKPLTKTNQDAQLFVTVLKARRNLPDDQIMLLKDVHKAEFKRGMEWLRAKARPQDVAMIFYSGHGAQVKDPTNTSEDGLDEAFVPYDFETNPKPSGKDLIWAHEFANWVNALRTDHVITVIDACHSAGLYRSLDSAIVGAKPKAYRPPPGLDLSMPAEERAPRTRAMAGRGRPVAKGVLLAAARRDQSALEGEDGGVFVMTLLRLIYNSSDGSLGDFFVAAQSRVNQQTQEKQSPQAVGDLDGARRLNLKK